MHNLNDELYHEFQYQSDKVSVTGLPVSLNCRHHIKEQKVIEFNNASGFDDVIFSKCL